jgi:regulatory protein
MIAHLITEGYINEERFAKLYAGGKFRQQKWGRLKIVQALEGKGLTKNCIRSGLKEIDEEDYRKTIAALALKKAGQVNQTNIFVTRDQVSRYIIQKGFEPDLVWSIVKEMFR